MSSGFTVAADQRRAVQVKGNFQAIKACSLFVWFFKKRSVVKIMRSSCFFNTASYAFLKSVEEFLLLLHASFFMEGEIKDSLS